jgi:hypothetical protein
MPGQQPKRPVSELKPADLQQLVETVQKILWMDTDREAEPVVTFWNNEKEWTQDTVECIAQALQDYGLTPIDPPYVIGFKSVDEFAQHIEGQAESPEVHTNPHCADAEEGDDWIGGDGASI